MPRVTFAEKLKVAEFIKANIAKSENGFWEYMHNLTDTQIAKQFDVSVGVVSGIRMETCGQLRAARSMNAGDYDVLQQRVSDMEDYLTRKHPGWRETLL